MINTNTIEPYKSWKMSRDVTDAVLFICKECGKHRSEQNRHGRACLFCSRRCYKTYVKRHSGTRGNCSWCGSPLPDQRPKTDADHFLCSEQCNQYYSRSLDEFLIENELDPLFNRREEFLAQASDLYLRALRICCQIQGNNIPELKQ